MQQFKDELSRELDNILSFWIKNMVDEDSDGFHGRITGKGFLDKKAPRGLVLNARICRTFSAAYSFSGNELYRSIAERSLQYIITHFYDAEHGGFYWSVDAEGKPLETKKQTYGQAFCCYAFSDFYRATGKDEAREWAIHVFHWIEQYSFDDKSPGYIEGLSRDWKSLDDLRLSDKDENEVKTTNTHLHLLEAYTSLYLIHKDPLLEKRLRSLLYLFDEVIPDPVTGHLRLFFDEEWRAKGNMISYGHEIETSWLMVEAAAALGEQNLKQRIKKRSLDLARISQEGMDSDGGLWHEYKNGILVREKHWWNQAEALIGYFNAWQISGEENFHRQSRLAWNFIKKYLLDHDGGEWHWGVKDSYELMSDHDKAGFWKCPYHNSRACMEMIRRIEDSLNC